MRNVLAAAIGGAALLTMGDGSAAGHTAFCSIDRLGAFTLSGNTLFIGTATNDSLASSQPTFRRRFVRDSVLLPGPSFSQVVRIDRMSVSASAELQRAIEKSRGRVLLVPWVYGPDCSPGTWLDQALWLTPGTQGFFSGHLRPVSEWIGGMPTFDVGSPYDMPYPSARGFEIHLRGGTPLTADQIMTFYDSLPRVSYERVERITQLMREQAYRDAVLKLAEGHPEFVSRPPTASIIRLARQQTALHPYYLRPSELAGTWRFIVTMPGRDSVVLYGRTRQHPSSLIASADGTVRQWQLGGRPPFGYYLHMVMTKTLADLDIGRWPPPQRQGYLGVSFDPEITTSDSTVWAGGADIYGAQSALPDSSTFRSVFSSLRHTGTIGMRPDRPRYAPGRIILKRDGSARLEFIYTDNDDTVFPRVRAERISTVVWNPDGA